MTETESHPGRPGRDLGRIHAGSDVLWTARCRYCPWCDLGPRTSGPYRGLAKATAMRMARRHAAAFPTHTVLLEAVTWQLVYGPAVP